MRLLRRFVPRNDRLFIGIFALLFLIICIFDFKLIVFAVAIILILCLPGYLFYTLIFPEKKLAILESGALFFTLGMSLFLIPSILAYQLKLSWAIFSILWVFELVIVLSILRIKRIRLLENVFLRMERIDYFLLFLFVLIAAAMYLHGGHFVGDASYHLFRLMKIAKNSNISSISISFHLTYGFNLFYSIFAFFFKSTGIELRYLWDMSPALFSLIINSAFYFFSLRFFKKKTFIFISFLFFFFYQYNLNWGDFKFLPYPDQIARNIFLFVSFGILLNIKKNEPAWKKYLLLISCSLWAMCMTHLYSFITFYYIIAIFWFLSILFIRDKQEKKFIFRLGLIISLIGFALISLRLTLTGNFSKYFRILQNFIRENLTIFLYIFILLIILIPIYFIISKISQYDYINKKGFGLKLDKFIYLFIFPVFIFIFIEFFLSINSLEYILDYIRGPRPYDFIINELEKYSILFFFLIIFISLIFWGIRKKKRIKQDESRVLLFMFSCLTAVYLFKFKTISLFLIKIVKETFVRRFFHYGLYSYLLIPVSLLVLYNAIPLEKIQTKKILLFKKIAIIFVCLFIGFGLFDLFSNHTKNDKYNHEYIMRTENVFVFIRKNIPTWSKIGISSSKEHEIQSQTPHLPVLTRFRINKPEELPYDHLLIHNTEDRSPQTVSLIFFRKKVSLLPEIFKEMYKDDTYTLYQIDKSVEMNTLEASTIQRINQFIASHNFEEAYEQSFRLLILNKSEEHLALNEKIRNELYKIDPEKTKLTPTFSFLNASSVPSLEGIHNDMNLVLDQEGHPSIQYRIYALFKKLENNNDTENSYIIDFNCERTLHEFKLEWRKRSRRALAFSIDYFDGEIFETLVEKKNNEKLINHIKLENPVITKKIKITVTRFDPALNEARLNILEIR